MDAVRVGEDDIAVILDYQYSRELNRSAPGKQIFGWSDGVTITRSGRFKFASGPIEAGESDGEVYAAVKSDTPHDVKNKVNSIKIVV